MPNIYDTKITVYRGTSYNPDGSPVYWSFCTAFFPSEEEGGYFDGGEYLFDVDENNEIYPTGTVGNAVEYDEVVEYRNYCEMMISERSCR